MRPHTLGIGCVDQAGDDRPLSCDALHEPGDVGGLDLRGAGQLGYAGLALLMVVEALPADPVGGGAAARRLSRRTGDFTFVGALVASTFGSVVGAVVLEEAARHGGRPFAERFVRFARQDPAKLDDAERWFRRRGWLMVLAGRCIPGVRSLVALPAGVLRMPRVEYIVLTLIGSTVWNAVLIAAGTCSGRNGSASRTPSAAGRRRCWCSLRSPARRSYCGTCCAPAE